MMMMKMDVLGARVRAVCLWSFAHTHTPKVQHNAHTPFVFFVLFGACHCTHYTQAPSPPLPSFAAP